MTYDLPFDDAYEPYHASSPTDRVILELQMYGHRPHQDEPDPRPLPEDEVIRAGLAGIVETFAGMLGDTRLEPDLDDLLWSFTNVFHRAAERVTRSLDRNEEAQRSSQREQDGSEVKSVELERLTAEGITYIERRNVLEIMRDEAADLYEAQTGSAWRPRSGSKVNHRNLTSAVIDSRDFLAARRRAETEILLPNGPKIALTGGLDFNDHNLIWDKLDQIHAKYEDMVLLHGGAKTGADLIADKWASTRNVTVVPFPPNFVKYPRKQAPFKRNDDLLEVMPIGVVVFPGGGIQANLRDKARRLGIPVWEFSGDGA